MSLRRNIGLAVAVTVIGIIAYLVGGLLYAWHHVPEAYAAWDTGSLLVAYMESHDGRWPRGWDDLLSVLHGEGTRSIMMRGAEASDSEYPRRLREMVSIDWSFDPATSGPDERPVVRPDNSRFPMVWEHADPNEMVHRYIEGHLKASPKGAE